MDKYLDYALWLTVRELGPRWFPAFQNGGLHLADHPKHLLFALESLASAETLQPLLRMLRDRKIAGNQEADVWALVAGIRGPADLDAVLDRVFREPKLGTAARVKLLDALEQASIRRETKPAGGVGRIEPLFDADDELIRLLALRLAGRWKSEPARPKLLAIARDDKAKPTVRRAALEGLAFLGGAESKGSLEELAKTGNSQATRLQAAVALATLDVKKAAARAADLLSTGPPAWNPAEVVTAFVQHKQGPEALAAALKDLKLTPDIAKLAVRTLRASGRDIPALEPPR